MTFKEKIYEFLDHSARAIAPKIRNGSIPNTHRLWSERLPHHKLVPRTWDLCDTKTRMCVLAVLLIALGLLIGALLVLIGIFTLIPKVMFTFTFILISLYILAKVL